MRESIERYDAVAKKSGARIVHASGFDSIPSDLGVYLLHDAAGAPLGETVMAVRWASGGFSGGTIASGIGQMEAAKADPALRRVMEDPYALTPGEAGPDEGDQIWVHYEPVLDSWTGPFMMAMINTRVVRRSNMLLGYEYGRDFTYKRARRVASVSSSAVRCRMAGSSAPRSSARVTLATRPRHACSRSRVCAWLRPRGPVVCSPRPVRWVTIWWNGCGRRA